ncbi:MAG: YdcF family protein [Candidatus Microsaccharimonas sp.]
MKYWLIIIPLLIIGFITAVSFYLQPNDFIGCADKPQIDAVGCKKADAIVVVSGGDTQARTDEAIRLFNDGWAGALVLSGAAQDKTGLSNAAAMRVRALVAGVPAEAIYIDELSETTEENAKNSGVIFKEHNFDRVILVTSGYHQRRALLEFERNAGSVEVFNRPVLNDKDWSFWSWWLSARGWWLAGGELARVIVFYGQRVF